MGELATEQVKKIPNPKGKGGFGDHPELINAGGRPKNQESFSYWMNYFKNLTIDEFRDYQDPDHPRELREKYKKTMTMAALGAFSRVAKMVNDLAEFYAVANRTEGMPKQSIQYGLDETISEIEVKIVKNETKPIGDNSIPK